MHRLIYVSRQKPIADLDHEIGLIIRASIANNRACAVTGLLLAHDGWFIQALEGPATEVLETYSRIVDDPRHSDCQVIAAGPAERREFADWDMCARRLTAGDDAILDALSLRRVFAPADLTPRNALRLLKAVRGIQERVRLSA
jgi:hypothetical protein